MQFNLFLSITVCCSIVVSMVFSYVKMEYSAPLIAAQCNAYDLQAYDTSSTRLFAYFMSVTTFTAALIHFVLSFFTTVLSISRRLSSSRYKRPKLSRTWFFLWYYYWWESTICSYISVNFCISTSFFRFHPLFLSRNQANSVHRPLRPDPHNEVSIFIC